MAGTRSEDEGAYGQGQARTLSAFACEQAALFQELPDYLARMSLLEANTSLREQEVCRLKWAGEVEIPELNTSVRDYSPATRARPSPDNGPSLARAASAGYGPNALRALVQLGVTRCARKNAVPELSNARPHQGGAPANPIRRGEPN